MVREALRDSFTQDELRAIGKVDVIFGPVPDGYKGMFYRRYSDSDVTIITFDTKLAENDDYVHEFVHALRAGDTSRTGFAATPYKRKDGHYDLLFARKHKNDLSNIEESAVVAESAIRTKNPAKVPSGYYNDVPGTKKDMVRLKKAYEEDRLTLLDMPKGTKVQDTAGVKGKSAVNKLNKNFPKTNISKKRVAGRSVMESIRRLKDIDK